MKILFFIESLGSGGKERRLLELIKYLSNKEGVTVELVLTKKIIHYDEIFATKVKIHYTVRTLFKKDPKVFFKFFKIARKFKPDIIHVWGNLTAIYAIPTKLILGKPMVNSQITNAPSKVSKSFFSHWLTFQFSDRIISNTYAGLVVYDVPIFKSQVIYNGFDFSRIKNLPDKDFIRNKLKVNTKFVVGMVATFDERKDYDTYIRAAKLILQNNRDITFLCIGKGNDSNFKKMVGKNDRKNILFLGRQSNVEAIMNICDVGILLTNNEKHGEGISNAILEFSALEKPVIATLGGGNPEIIEQNSSGFLINPRSPMELHQKVLFFINNQSHITEFGKRSLIIVKNKFSIGKMMEAFDKVYMEIKEY